MAGEWSTRIDDEVKEVVQDCILKILLGKLRGFRGKLLGLSGDELAGGRGTVVTVSWRILKRMDEK